VQGICNQFRSLKEDISILKLLTRVQLEICPKYDFQNPAYAQTPQLHYLCNRQITIGAHPSSSLLEEQEAGCSSSNTQWVLSKTKLWVLNLALNYI